MQKKKKKKKIGGHIKEGLRQRGEAENQLERKGKESVKGQNVDVEIGG